MSDETTDQPEEVKAEPTVTKKTARKKRAAKKVATKKVAKESSGSDRAETAPPQAAEEKKVDRAEESKPPEVEVPVSSGDSPDDESRPVIAEPPSSDEQGSGKRKRRRRRRGGGNAEGEERPQPSEGPRPKLDPELVAKKAWRIYLSEVSEEGLALINDHDARELSRRSFRLAEIFLEEASKRS